MRSNGVASRRLILDAAAEIARERGYHGTSISAVSKRSGLPNSSIYWHFESKEALFGAVIDDSYQRWSEEALERDDERRTDESFDRLAARFRRVPDFICIGLALTLERSPDGEGTPLHRYAELRGKTVAAFRSALRNDHPHLTRPQAHALAAMTMSLIDGSVVAELNGENTPTPRVLASAIQALASSMRNE